MDLERILKRGVAEIIVEEEFREKLVSGRKLRLKLGFDPSQPDLHIGHGVVLRKLRQLQELGHQVVLVVGDWTAQIGDPSGRDETRTMLTPQEVKANAQTYMEQFFMIVDEERTEVRWQSEWYEGFTLAAVFNLASRFTLGQLMAHETFRKRYEEGLPLTIMELMYPLLQAYDSVAIEADVEFGGTDQKFNNLAGRELQRMMGLPPQDVFLVPLLPGTDGRKMGKTLDNTINFIDPPDKMYGKVMSITDEMLITYFTLTTDVPDEEIEEMSRALEEGTVNPRDLKMRLAREIVNQFHPKTRTISYTLDAILGRRLVDLLVDRSLAASESEATSLIQQGSVLLDGERVRDTHYMITDQGEHTIEIRGITHAEVAEREFIRIFRERELPSEMPTFRFSLLAAEPPAQWPDGRIRVYLNFGLPGSPAAALAHSTANSVGCSVVDILQHLGLTKSKSEGRRLIGQRGVRLNGEKIEAELIDLPLDRDSVLQVGKRRFVKLVPGK